MGNLNIDENIGAYWSEISKGQGAGKVKELMRPVGWVGGG